jgi:hypothetical protein
VIDQTIQIAIGNAAAPANIAPTNFNPIPADGFIEVWGCIDPLPHADDTPPIVSITLGGATPYTPVPSAVLKVNTDGVQGAGPDERTDKIMSRQGVRQGTNFQLNVQGGTSAQGDTQVARFRIRFVSADEVAAGAGAVAA